eukprot:Lithocolla_globosa_v1_NODE_661_length_3486_cov_8.188283.p1 type:complete len:286 gc:universal NODE_661_length_3486_cov_8.188283:2167-1310(-)
MLEQMLPFLKYYKILTKHQYGFLKKISTTTALLDFCELLLQHLDIKSMKGTGTFIDFSKAFDTVNHEILLTKLALYGIDGPALQLIQSYLSGRTQVVKIDHIVSDEMTITCDVPQGSILGPLFFILYINDLPQALSHSSPYMFVDYTTILTLNTNFQILQNNALQDLKSLSTWCKVNLLTINCSKTAYLLLCSAQTQIPTFPTDNLPQAPPPVITSSSTTSSKKKDGYKTTTTIHTTTTKISQAITHRTITHTVTTITHSSSQTIVTSPLIYNHNQYKPPQHNNR